ncbi:MAG: asparagine synthase-related protein [Piscinibacter sp.]|uniref:asparagine synthase-related protein n=1 Tax=Piscinibacter sp. TaxID=1903157 RepID=UPI003D0C27A8
MSLFAGVVCLRPEHALPEHLPGLLAGCLSRYPGDRPLLLVEPGAAVAHLDLGVLGGQGVCREAGSPVLSVLSGEPLCSGKAHARSRDADLQALHDDWRRGRTDALRLSRGNFCIAHVDMAERRVRLASDKLALRALYVAQRDGVLYFAASMRVMLALVPELEAEPDYVGQAQIAALGGPLGARTAYASIRCLEAGIALDIDSAGTRECRYHSWDELPERPRSEEEFTAELHAVFRSSVALRLGDDRSVAAHLSGGLDSRCVVATLRDFGAKVHTLNFAPPESADLVLGREAARSLGSHHFESASGSTDFWRRMETGHREWLAAQPPDDAPPRPSRVFTGFAGETVLAPTNLNAAIIAAMRRGDHHAAMRGYLKRIGGELSRRLFLRSRRAEMTAAVPSAIADELARRRSADPARRMHLFQLLNEPRANLARHHENLDTRRFEFTTPFCDASFVETVLSWRIDDLPRHHLYYRWLRQFPAAVREVPWQAYPWSEPCPLPMPRDLRNQWAEDWIHENELREELSQLVAQTRADLASEHFPAGLLDRDNLRLACLLTKLGLHRYAYFLRHAHVFVRHAALNCAPGARPSR